MAEADDFDLGEILKPFAFEEVYRFHFPGGKHWADIRRSKPQNRAFAAKVQEHKQAITDHLAAPPDPNFMTGSEEGDMALCADIIVAAWSLPIPLEEAVERVFKLPKDQDPKEAGRELFFRFMEISKRDNLFKSKDGEQDDAKNSQGSSKKRRA